MMSAVGAEEETLHLEETMSLQIPSPGELSPKEPTQKTPDLPVTVQGIDEDDLGMDTNPSTTAPAASASGPGDEDSWAFAVKRLGSAVRSGVSEAARAVSAATAVGKGGVSPRFIAVGDEHTASSDGRDGWLTLLREEYGTKARFECYAAAGYNATWGSRLLLRALRDENDVKVAIIWFGTNDAADPPATNSNPVEEYRLVLAKMALHCINERVVPVLMTPPPNPSVENNNAELYADQCKRIAEELKVPCVDVYGAMNGDAEKVKGLIVSNDTGPKLTKEGNSQVSKLILELVQSKMSKYSPARLNEAFIAWKLINSEDPTDTLGVGL